MLGSYPPKAEFAFTQDLSFVVDRTQGVYSFDGDYWTLVSNQADGVDACAESDIVFIGFYTGNSLKIINGIVHSSIPISTRIESKNGDLWYSSSTSSGLVRRLNGTNIAYNGTFVDTITQYNTTNMPSPSVWEIEFDENDNIWAVFGTDYNTISHVGFLDRSIMNWTVYNGGNSPIDFIDRVTIELHTDYNSYVCDGDLHVLDLHGLPQWLSVKENDLIHFDVYPNPSTGQLNIDIPENVEVSDIRVLDVSGREISVIDFEKSIELNISRGMYLL